MKNIIYKMLIITAIFSVMSCGNQKESATIEESDTTVVDSTTVEQPKEVSE